MFISEAFVRVVAALLAALTGVYVLRVVWSFGGRRFASGPDEEDLEERAAELAMEYRRHAREKGDPAAETPEWCDA